ncbi:type II toxin-antitoxin system prevent-host-death family antitoxin [Pseudoduganella sp. FT55W]|uniref:Type II toxin-antitoxin system prevent-host-death family antitoxin n=1 Tax=Duganella rivi TaxID=2666083 RepID=A0A7X4KCU9_9BURK|nr:type II toxin-antitoxin system Phd/YefM family antitoxin [Duganella rivi]MYM69621.1 type II toxin-antitoxin system prevent-host-death family antitoxin [Duganella rivi]
MKTVTIAEAQEQLDRLIALVEAGEEVTIIKDGVAVACVVASASRLQRLPSLAEFRAQQPWQSESAGDFIRKLRDTDRY